VLSTCEGLLLEPEGLIVLLRESVLILCRRRIPEPLLAWEVPSLRLHLSVIGGGWVLRATLGGLGVDSLLLVVRGSHLVELF